MAAVIAEVKGEATANVSSNAPHISARKMGIPRYRFVTTRSMRSDARQVFDTGNADLGKDRGDHFIPAVSHGCFVVQGIERQKNSFNVFLDWASFDFFPSILIPFKEPDSKASGQGIAR